MNHNQQALETAVLAGQILLENGAEISRVQGTIIRFLLSFGVHDHHVYVISNGIFATAGEAGDCPCSAVRHVQLGQIHMGRIAAVNELSREVARPGAAADPGIVRERLLACKSLPSVRAPLALFACGLGSAGFCYILGGAPLDSAAAFVAGALLQAFNLLLGKTSVNRFIAVILGGALVTVLGRALLACGVGLSLDNIIIGSIMPLVPGVALTTSIRSFFNSDYISGGIQLTDALLVAASIAVGVGSALRLLGYFGAAL